MRTSYAFRDFLCGCGQLRKKLVEIYPKHESEIDCECGGSAKEIEVSRDLVFKPFWSDTLQTRIKDKIDLQRLRQYAKDNGLVNVGHVHQKPDRRAIRHNYDN